MRLGTKIVVVVLAAAGFVLALAPFTLPGASSVTLPNGHQASDHCSAPIVSAFRAEHFQNGWYGYAPLRGEGVHTKMPSIECRPPARHRLILAGWLWLAAAAGLVGSFVLRRRRQRAHPPDEPAEPVPAT